MSYYLGKLSTNEYLLLDNNSTIKFTFKTKSFEGVKTFFKNNYLNVLNPDNFLYNLEQNIDSFIQKNHPGYTLKSNIIFSDKQFIQFKVNKNQVIEPETNLILTVEVDKIKLNPKNKEYSIVLHLSKLEFV